MKTVGILLVILASASFSFGQDMNWPEDRATAELKVALYADEVEFENYRSAADHLYWLLVNAPNLHLSIYQNGAKIYENLAIEETDQEQRQIYLDSLMIMYDLRMRYYDDSTNVMNRKAYKAYRYYIRDKDKIEWLLQLFDETVIVTGDQTMSNNIPAYMNIIMVNRLNRDNLTLEQVFDRYERLIEILDHKSGKGEDVGKIRDLVDKLLTETIPEGIDCDFVIANLGPKHYENTSDIALAKRIFSFMLNGKCTDEALFLDVSKEIQQQEPSFGIGYKVIGKKCLVAKDYKCAEKYLLEALTLTRENEEKVEVYNDLGRLYSYQDLKEQSREHYRKAILLDNDNKEAFNGLGNLYYYSAQDCAQQMDVVEDRLPYIAAFQMYEKGANEKMMQASKEQFPSKEEIFSANLESGQVLTVKCWIGESVILKTRD